MWRGDSEWDFLILFLYGQLMGLSHGFVTFTQGRAGPISGLPQIFFLFFFLFFLIPALINSFF